MESINKSDCSIIITTYNGVKWIEKCISSCKESAYPVNIIVVDNNSTDHTLDLLPDDIHIVKLAKNVGFGRANNIGMMEAFNEFDSKYVFLLNQDAYLKEDTITELVKFQQENPKYGLVSPLHFDGGGKEYDYRFKIYLGRSKSPKKKLHREKGIYEVRFVNAAGWFLTKEAVMKNGGFDPVFFHTGEDDNFCQRLRYNKIPITITNRAAILHDRGDRIIPKTPPHLRVANRSKIVIYNPDMGFFGKFILLIPLAYYFVANLTLPYYRKKEKLKKDFNELKVIMKYAKIARGKYDHQGLFLEDDYPLKPLSKKPN